jgi:hypothetical protein
MIRSIKGQNLQKRRARLYCAALQSSRRKCDRAASSCRQCRGWVIRVLAPGIDPEPVHCEISMPSMSAMGLVISTDRGNTF